MPRLPSLPAIALAALLAVVAAVTAPTAHAAGAATTRAALERQMDRVGARSGALAVDLKTGEELFAARASRRRTPASVQKLYTTSTVLRRLGADTRLRTSVLAEGEVDADGRLAGDLYLRGAGDPSLSSTQLVTLARALVSEHGLQRVDGSVVGDATVFDARRGPPSSGFRTSGYVGPLSGLSVDRGLTRLRSPFFQASPPRFVSQALQRALRREGVRFAKAAHTATAPATAVTELGAIASPTLGELAARTNTPSDNFFAETLLKLVGIGEDERGSTASGARAVRAALAELDIAPKIADGSGLSRANATSPRQVVALLRAMRTDPSGPALTASLAVAGRTGTLVGRMRATPAAGNCRAKTGTLTGVSALAGYCTSADGHPIAFAFLMNRTSLAAARAAQDAMAVALARFRAG